MDNQSIGTTNSTSSVLGNVSTPSVWNNSQQALVYTLNIIENASDDDAHQVRLLAINQFASPTIIVTAILLVFLCSPTIIIGNSLVLISIYRFKRLRTPSNYLVMSLATSDLGVGMYMPVGMYLEVCGVGGVPSSASLCLLNYSVPITLCCVSVLVMVAIAVDRFTSLARPLRYNNLITHTAMERYIAVFWIYAALVGISPFSYHMFYGTPNYQSTHCSFGNLVPRPIQLFMFCAVYGPSACILLVCYGYIYVVARGHARAISEVRHSLQYGHGSNQPRYGLALAITTGMFLTLWLPFQICMLLDVFTDTKILVTHWIVIYLALPIVSSSAFNPWIYGYRNAELRLAVQKVIDDMLTILGFNYRSHPMTDAHVVPPSIAATAGDAGSLINIHNYPNFHNSHQPYENPIKPTNPASNEEHSPPIRREYYSWNPDDDFLLVPMAKPDSPGFLSLDDDKQCHHSVKNISLNLTQLNHQLNTSGKSLNNNVINEKKFLKNHKCKNLNLHLNFHFTKDYKDNNKDNKEQKPLKEHNEMDEEKYNGFNVKDNRKKQNYCNRPGLRGSRSMIESFAGLRNGTDVLIFKGKNLMLNGASIV